MHCYKILILKWEVQSVDCVLKYILKTPRPKAQIAQRIVDFVNSASVRQEIIRWSFALVAQAGVQWHHRGSLQPPSAKFKQLSCLSFPSSWDNRDDFRRGSVMNISLILGSSTVMP
ncbi:UPF0764 protein C16orf89-like [Saimiri boliviensis]|uniref:UPF0764 protein C16orf89-like n=1 Tax=Saimiri boliviensis TaxID=27679 RepID=UPI003D788E6A